MRFRFLMIYDFWEQSYTYFLQRQIENRTSSLQTACKFIASPCKKDCK